MRRRLNMRMLKHISVLAAVALIVSLTAMSMVAKAVAQPSSPNSTAPKAPDSVEKLFAKTPPMTMAGAGQANNYSAWLFVCKAPPITDAESQCDTPTRLH